MCPDALPVRWIAAMCLAGPIEGRIVGVHDGDTITLLDADVGLSQI